MNNLLFLAFADENRRRILEELRRGRRTAGQLCELFDISKPAVSRHLKVLRDAMLVDVEKHKTSRIYYLRREGFESIQQYLDRFRDDGLRMPKALAEEEEKEKADG